MPGSCQLPGIIQCRIVSDFTIFPEIDKERIIMFSGAIKENEKSGLNSNGVFHLLCREQDQKG